MKKIYSLIALSFMFVLAIGFASACHCGDGIINLAWEQCDDGNHINGDGCSYGSSSLDHTGCQTESGWNCTRTWGKLSVCTPLLICGNGIKQAGEECDDGNTNNLDSCRNNCKLPYCGDGNLDNGEECDGGENCTANCTTEPPIVPEFGTIICMLTALSALGIFFIVRRK